MYWLKSTTRILFIQIDHLCRYFFKHLKKLNLVEDWARVFMPTKDMQTPPPQKWPP